MVGGSARIDVGERMGGVAVRTVENTIQRSSLRCVGFDAACRTPAWALRGSANISRARPKHWRTDIGCWAGVNGFRETELITGVGRQRFGVQSEYSAEIPEESMEQFGEGQELQQVIDGQVCTKV